MITGINGKNQLVQKTFGEHLPEMLCSDSVYATTPRPVGPHGTLGRPSERDVVLTRDLLATLGRLNPDVSEAAAREPAIEQAPGPTAEN
jgi:type I restriction enzyme, R subunit